MNINLENLRDGRQGGLQSYIGEYLIQFIIDQKIRTVVETGVSWGFSSYYFLTALKVTGGKLYSIEANLMPLNERIVPLTMYENWEIYEGKSIDVLPELVKQIKDIDLFWHDSDHSYKNQLFEYRTVFPYSKYIGSHDIYRRNKSAWDLFIQRSPVTEIFKDSNFGMVKVNK